ncbi:MAG: tautomerase family protein [Azonexus sp.]|jgi:4-oxalocrotonate tautomerase|nr:tautomerase family protein [Azonexus sp.]
MPILNIHLVSGQHDPAKVDALLKRCSESFAAGLCCPIDRVRVFVTEHAPRHYCVGGQLVSETGMTAPYFSFIVLDDRPLVVRQKLLSAFTDHIVELLGAPRERVRGGIMPVAAADWSIGGQAASLLRQTEIEARR